MASIYLIRHGQASFGQANYDQLSDKGCAQSSLLGAFWHALPTPDKLITGDMQRHKQTCDNFISGYQGMHTPRTVDAGFNEFDHINILTCYNPKWQNFAQMSESMAKQPNANKLFQQTFTGALNAWISDQGENNYKESWGQFKQRCLAALDNVITQQLAIKKASNKDKSAQDICIFTSGGTISVIVQHVLGLSDQKAMMVNQQLRNTSVTKLLFSQDNLSIDYFNNHSHLAQAGDEWITFR
jgi:broad specificity phosphatase PhoE